VFCLDAGATSQLAPRGGLHGVLLVMAVALTSSVLGTSVFMAGVRKLGASRASIVSSAEPALTTIFRLPRSTSASEPSSFWSPVSCSRRYRSSS
jgi:drug/metabolite transporter (DMT)-like permease